MRTLIDLKHSSACYHNYHNYNANKWNWSSNTWSRENTHQVLHFTVMFCPELKMSPLYVQGHCSSSTQPPLPSDSRPGGHTQPETQGVTWTPSQQKHVILKQQYPSIQYVIASSQPSYTVNVSHLAALLTLCSWGSWVDLWAVQENHGIAARWWKEQHVTRVTLKSSTLCLTMVIRTFYYGRSIASELPTVAEAEIHKMAKSVNANKICVVQTSCKRC